MKTKNPRYGSWALILVLIVVLTALLGTAIGKYIKTERFSGTLTITAELGSITLQEHKAERQTDGSYKLGTDIVVSNKYTLIPGLDIPKDPHIVITGKTEIEAYLFVEVVDKTNEAITWEIADGWTLLDGVTGKKDNGTVYVYNTVLDENFTGSPVYILKGDQITVSQELLTEDAAAADTLTFYASMGETAASDETEFIKKAAEVYGTVQEN